MPDRLTETDRAEILHLLEEFKGRLSATDVSIQWLERVVGEVEEHIQTHTQEINDLQTLANTANTVSMQNRGDLKELRLQFSQQLTAQGLALARIEVVLTPLAGIIDKLDGAVNTMAMKVAVVEAGAPALPPVEVQIAEMKYEFLSGSWVQYAGLTIALGIAAWLGASSTDLIAGVKALSGP